MTPTSAADRSQAHAHVEELLVRLTVLRRQPRYRQALVEGTGLDGRVTTMRIVRAINDLSAAGALPSVREVADRLVMEQSNASRAVDQAVEHGLVSKAQSSQDGRRLELELTSSGRAAVAELDARREAVNADLLRDWRPEDLADLSRLLERLCAEYERLAGR